MIAKRWLQRYQERKEYQKIHSKIESMISREKQDMSKESKVILVGASETGKSTFIKQMKILYGGGFGAREREDARDIVVSNLVVSVYVLLCHTFQNSDNSNSQTLLQLTKCLYLSLTRPEKKEVSFFVPEVIRPTSEDDAENILKWNVKGRGSKSEYNSERIFFLIRRE